MQHRKTLLKRSYISLLGALILVSVTCFSFVASKAPMSKVYGTVMYGNRVPSPLQNGSLELYQNTTLITSATVQNDGSYELFAKKGSYLLKLIYSDKDSTFPIVIVKGIDLEKNIVLPPLPMFEFKALDSAKGDAGGYYGSGEVITSDEVENLVKNRARVDFDREELSEIVVMEEVYDDGVGSADYSSVKRSSMDVKDLGAMSAPPMSAETAYPVSKQKIDAKAGTLTAGELNDFTKFELWTDIAEGSLKAHAERWGMKPNDRYTLLLTNQEGGAVVGAEVLLQTDDGQIVWAATSNNAGRVELWSQLFATGETEKDLQVHINYQGNRFSTKDLVSAKEGINHLSLPVSCYNPVNVDLAFVVDATGSMADEIAYLQVELEDVITEVQEQNQALDIRTASLFYRDSTDDYVSRISDFDTDLSVTTSFIQEQSAKGGGDRPEAVDAALESSMNQLSWRQETRAKLLFLILDAPPHEDPASAKRVKDATAKASKMGVRIIPVVASGADKSTEYLMRSLALATNGTYLFLTDHGGVGGAHMAPTTDAYDVTYLNQLMKEVITRYTTAGSCHNDALAAIDPELTVIDEVKGSETSRNEGPKPQVELQLKNDVLANKDEVDEIAKSDKKELNRLQKESDKSEQTIYSLFPNPTSGQLNVFTSTEQSRILLMDLSGKLLREFNSNGQLQFSVDVSEYPPGLYFIGFYQEDKLHTERFVLSK